jgi:sugar phosphate isomerase/epimerase
MFEISLSTVACPHLPLVEALALAAGAGYDAVELRTFGPGSTRFASDPALSDEARSLGRIRASGLTVSSIATGVRFDAPVVPPILGRVFNDEERAVREAERAIDIAAQLDCSLVRVFAFERHGRESQRSALKRVARRLALVCDHARNTGVRVVVENGGSFASAAELSSLLEAVGSPWLGACYNAAVGRAAGDEPARAVRLLGDALLLGRVKDAAGGRPVLPGRGELEPQGFIRALAEAQFRGTVVFEWDAAWSQDAEPAHEIVGPALRQLVAWATQGQPHAHAVPA